MLKGRGVSVATTDILDEAGEEVEVGDVDAGFVDDGGKSA